MTNCRDLRNLLSGEPQRLSGDVRQHLSQCEACRAYAARIGRAEERLHEALSIPVPEQLAERILLRSELFTARDGRRARWLRPPRSALLAVAALLLIFGVGAWLRRGPSPSASQWLDVVVEHVKEERATLALDGLSPPDALATSLKEYRLELKGSLGAVRYVDHCDLPGGVGVHIVIDTPDLGKVSLIVLPRGVRPGSGSAQRGDYAAGLMQISRTTIGLVTERPDRLKALIERVRGHLVVSA